jgi:hypothetical protein
MGASLQSKIWRRVYLVGRRTLPTNSITFNIIL